MSRPQRRATDPPLADGLWLALLGLVVRGWVVVWAAGRFPPTADGHFYHVVADRVAHGHGYTWLWPDGTVTFAAHYPVGYPALLGVLYAVFGSQAGVAMAANAVLGALGVLAVHRVTARAASRSGAALGALLVALHPTLVAYTPALMTEGVVAVLLALAAWVAVVARGQESRRRWLALLALGLVLGAATLVRPQSLLLAPVLGWLGWGGRGWRDLAGSVVVSALVVATCLPWTARNCQRMGRCLFVSANAGWNLLIGAGEGATGSWVPIEQAGIPVACRDVFDEAEKDYCFGRAALERIGEHPGRWLGLVPEKLDQTFDASGTPGWYLETSGGARFSATWRRRLGVAEVVWQRAILLFGGLALAWPPRPERTRWARRLLVVAAVIGLLQTAVWVSYLALSVAALLLGRTLRQQVPAMLAAATVIVTALTHVVFFGAGRYSMVCYALLAALAGTALGQGCTCRELFARMFRHGSRRADAD